MSEKYKPNTGGPTKTRGGPTPLRLCSCRPRLAPSPPRTRPGFLRKRLALLSGSPGAWREVAGSTNCPSRINSLARAPPGRLLYLRLVIPVSLCHSPRTRPEAGYGLLLFSLTDFFKCKCIGVTLASDISQVSSMQSDNTPSVCGIVRLPPKGRSSVTVHLAPFTLTCLSPPPVPLVTARLCLCP